MLQYYTCKGLMEISDIGEHVDYEINIWQDNNHKTYEPADKDG